MIELNPHVGVEALLRAICRHPEVEAVELRQVRRWDLRSGQTMQDADSATLGIVSQTVRTDVARLRLEGDCVAAYELAEDHPYRIVKIAAEVLR